MTTRPSNECSKPVRKSCVDFSFIEVTAQKMWLILLSVWAESKHAHVHLSGMW